MIDTIIIKFTLALFILHLIFLLFFYMKRDLMVVVVCKKKKSRKFDILIKFSVK